MNRAVVLWSALALVAGLGAASKASRPIYNQNADARRMIRAAVAAASRSGRNVVLVFGANW